MKKNYQNFFWLPDMITFFNLFSGFLSLFCSAQGLFQEAAWFIVLALIWDSLDGNIARIFNNPTSLGRELDSLCDAVSFVAAPAFMVTCIFYSHYHIWVMPVVGIYLACGIYRLARFNLCPPVKDFFEGLPTPAAAMVVIMTCVVLEKQHDIIPSFWRLSFLGLMILLSFLMISKVPYPKFSGLPFSKWKSLFYFAGGMIFISFSFQQFELAILAIAVLFLISPLWVLHSFGFKHPPSTEDLSE